MAQKRMFSLQVVDTDRFMDMPTSAQALYFHLGMHGDDDGFVASPKKIARAAGCNDDDLRLLAAKGFIIAFESGIVVVTDWLANNNLRNDRYRGTVYTEEKSNLVKDQTGRYKLKSTLETGGIPTVSTLEPQHNLTEHNKAENERWADKPPTTPARKRFVPPTLEEVASYCRERKNDIAPQHFLDYYEARGWKLGKNNMKDWKAAIRTWEKQGQNGASNTAKKTESGSSDRQTRFFDFDREGLL